MWKLLLVSVMLMLSPLGAAKRERGTFHQRSNDYDDTKYSSKKDYTNRYPTSTTKGEVIIEKFVETLVSSEQYLKMIENVERKLNHLDVSFHEKSNSITKYLNELMKLVKNSSPDGVDKSLLTIMSDIEKIKHSVKQQSQLRVEGGTNLRVDNYMDNRLGSMDSNIKSIMNGVESILSTISEVKNRQYGQNKATTRSNTGSVDALALINDFRRTMYEQQRQKKCDCNRNDRSDRSERYPTDCHEIQSQGFNVSGIYKIKPEDIDPFYVLCELTTAGGGWTVVQNRFDGSQDFYKSWSDYKNGFGNLAGEFWLGLDKIHFLTNQKLYELRVEVESQQGQEAYAGYSVFTIGPDFEGYRISTLGNFHGTAGDSLSYHAGQKFSTSDMDNDEWKEGSCASEHGGAWWYKQCDKSNLNGRYVASGDEHQGQSMYWISFKSPSTPLVKSKMMIRPLPASRPTTYENRKIPDRLTKKPPAQPNKIPALKVKPAYDLHNQRQSAYKYQDMAQDNPVNPFFANFA